MSLKTVFARHLGRHVKFGRKRPPIRQPRLRLYNYLPASLPEPPASCDYSAKAEKTLRNVYDNDRLGDCVIAGGAHVRGVTSGNAGAEVTFTDQQIIEMYSAIGGYVPGNDSTDQGCDEQTALNHWTTVGFPDGVKLAAWLAVDAADPKQCKQACWLFENLYFGVELPDAWVNPMPSGDGFVWDVAGHPDPNNGHCFMGMGYDDRGVKIDTWGLLGTLTWKAVEEYAARADGGELYVLLSPDMIARAQARAPSGLDWRQLILDFNALGGSLPVPPPIPAPEPSWADFLAQIRALIAAEVKRLWPAA